MGSTDPSDNDRDDNADWLRNVEPSKFRFPTKLQPVHMLMRRHSPSAIFRAQLELFEESRGRRLVVPRIGAQLAPLYHLYCAVVRRGGFGVIENDIAAWHELVERELPRGIDANARTLRTLYRDSLLAFELHCDARLPPTSDAEVAAAVRASEPLRQRLADFSYGDGGEWTLSTYRRMADEFASSYFDDSGGADDERSSSASRRSAVCVDRIEREYWSIVEGQRGAVEVPYGNDLSTVRTDGSHAPGEAHRTLFPTSARDDASYCAWNLNHLARARGSLLRHVQHTIPGITDPMLYVGMLFTTFCWHTEDNYLSSINYLHGGAPKVWYGVPSSHRAQFEALMRARYGELFALHPDLLFQLVTTLNPRELHQHDIPCVRAVQRGGEFVITFPASFHAGFNCGFNVAEAVNFGSECWLPFGRRSIEDYHKRDGNRPSAFSYHNLLCLAARAALANDMLRETAEAVVAELCAVRQDLIVTCAALAAAGVTRVDKFPLYDGEAANAEVDLIQCFDCQVDCYLLAVVCPCTPVGRLSCAKHYDRLCRCANASRCQLLRYSERKLQKLIDSLVAHLPSLVSLDDVGAPTRAQVREDARAMEKWRGAHDGARAPASGGERERPSRMGGAAKRRRMKM